MVIKKTNDITSSFILFKRITCQFWKYFRNTHQYSERLTNEIKYTRVNFKLVFCLYLLKYMIFLFLCWTLIVYFWILFFYMVTVYFNAYSPYQCSEIHNVSCSYMLSCIYLIFSVMKIKLSQTTSTCLLVETKY